MDIERLVMERLQQEFPELLAKVNQLDLETQIRQKLENMPKNSWGKSFSEILKDLLG